MTKLVYKSIDSHNKDVIELQKNILSRKSIHSLDKKNPSNTLRAGEYKKNLNRLNLSRLNQILYLDLEKQVLVTEPSITFATLCRQTLKEGWVVPVVPEFKEITLGGAIMGASLESSSHRFGQVSDVCLEYECLLGNGEILKASPFENKDLFYALSGSYGTLAILTLVTIRLIRAKKFVSLSYHRFSDLKEGLSYLKKTKEVDFKEAVGFGANDLVVVTGEMKEKAPTSLFSIKPWSLPFANRLVRTKKKEEAMHFEEYLFRFDLAAFWMGNYVSSFSVMQKILFKKMDEIAKDALYKQEPSLLFRLLFGWALTTKRLYRLWHFIPQKYSENIFFIHDFYVPEENGIQALRYFLEKTGITPFWLCPIAKTDTGQFLSPHFGGKEFLNMGFYGIPRSSKTILELSKELEKEIFTFGGRKMLYSLTYYDRDFFSKIYNLERYESLRKKFHAEQAFPHLYSKIVEEHSTTF